MVGVIFTFYIGPLASVNVVTTLNMGRKADERRLTALVAEVIVTSFVSGWVLPSSCSTIRNASTPEDELSPVILVGALVEVRLSLLVEVAGKVDRRRLIATFVLVSICVVLFLA